MARTTTRNHYVANGELEYEVKTQARHQSAYGIVD